MNLRQLKPGQWVAVGLDPVGYLMHGSKWSAKASTGLLGISPLGLLWDPLRIGYWARQASGLNYEQRMAAVQQPAQNQVRQTLIQQGGQLVQPVQALPASQPANRTGLLLGSAFLAGAVILFAAYWKTRSSR